MAVPARARRFGPVAPPPLTRVTVDDAERFALRLTVTPDEADRRGREAIQEGLLRPADSHRADIEAAQLVWVPVWRVDVAAEGFHVGVKVGTDAKGRLRSVMPTGGARHRDEVVLVLARKMLPWDPTPALALPLEALVSRRDLALDDGEELAPDMTREEAVTEARQRVLRALSPSRAVWSDYEARARTAVLCHVPVWLRRYRYEGEAAGREALECFVALSGATGEVLCARHPPAWRAVAGRVRRLFTRR